MTLRPLTMPKWGLSMQEGTVGAWSVREGAAISEGDELVDVETSKIVNTFEAPFAGHLRRIVGREGETLPVGALLAVLGPADAADEEIDAYVSDFQARFVPQTEEAGAGLESLKVTIGEARALRAAIAGEGDPPVVFLHGFGGDLDNWAAVQPALAGSRRTIAFDLPGHGESTKALAGASPADLAADVSRALDALDAPRVHLVGHSLGGAVALAFALAHPERTESLALICAAGLPGGRLSSEYLDGFLAARRARELATVLAQLFADPSLATRELAESVLKARRLDGADDALAAIREAIGSPAFAINEALLGSVTAPLLMIACSQDQVVGTPDPELLPAHARLITIDDAGHMPHAERPAAVISALRAHLG
ncbi:acetoin dehydrogenase dihydrolipoyllysine-residue acetyltransferase subunit [Rhabdaerophilum sp.]|uniref:acetoin dehydrogenase dihydrolipoyllysine-residue acetyltransferase subunit n=1 Tax=Rhabdaerophilum sp. TaxID=2717341 RepID=UPI0038D3F7E2